MILKVKRPHRIRLKDGKLRTYQPGYVVQEEDKELIQELKYHRLYRRDVYLSKLQATMQPSQRLPDEKKKEVKEKRSMLSKLNNLWMNHHTMKSKSNKEDESIDHKLKEDIDSKGE